MPQYQKKNIILEPGFIFSYVGLLGYVIFFLLRPSIDINSGNRIQFTNAEMQQKTRVLLDELEFDSANIPIFSSRFNDARLFHEINESLPNKIQPFSMNRAGIPLSGWRLTLATVIEEPQPLINDENIFSISGIVQLTFTETGRLLRLRTRENTRAQLVIQNSTLEGVERLITESFGYNTTDFKIVADTTAESFYDKSLNYWPQSGDILFSRIIPGFGEPETIRIEFEKKFDGYEYMLNLTGFHANYINTDKPTEIQAATSDGFKTLIISILTIILISLTVIITGIRQVFKRRVDWKRSLTILILVTLTYFMWVLGYYWNTFYLFIDGWIIFADLIQQFFVAIIFGFFAALSYISWESLARNLKSQQIPFIDAFWSGKLLQKQLGAGILTGYGVAGFYLGIIAVILFAFNGYYVLIDSTFFQTRDIVTAVPAFHKLLSAFYSSILGVVAPVGVAFCLLALWVRPNTLRVILTTIIAGFGLYAFSNFMEISFEGFYHILVYIVLAVPLVLAYRYFGLVSALISWFILLIVFKAIPLMGSPNTEITLNLWLLVAIFFLPFIIGLIGLRGKDIQSYTEFAPEYESAEKTQLRYQKELAIAKESQYALMPVSAPGVEGFDIRGFFLPSYEVGGDFYDYEVINDDTGETQAIALAIADVSGKAMKSAIHAVFTSGLLLSRIHSDSPENILTQINPILFKKTDKKTFITCQIGRINTKTKELVLSNAGHCPPLLKRNDKTTFIKTIEPRYPLGIKNKVDYRSVKVSLEKGDLLLFYSDGLAEAQNKKGERLDFDELIKLVDSFETDNLSTEDICTKIKRFILDYSNYELVDDTTVICVKVV